MSSKINSTEVEVPEASSTEAPTTTATTNGHVPRTNGIRMSKSNTSPRNEGTFFALFLVMQMLGTFMLAAILLWIWEYYGGFSWADHDLRFNFHPILMVLGMVYLGGNGILAFRVLKTVPKQMAKIVHASIHISALLFSLIGSIAVFTNHFDTGKPNLYSLHSWIGLSCVTLFFGQYVVAFYNFLFPTTSGALRSKLLPYHVLAGFAIFGLATMAALTGFAEKMAFDIKNYSNFSGRMWIMNFTGILLILFAMLVIYLGTDRQFKRHQVGEQLPLTQNFISNSTQSSPDANQ